MAGRNEDGIDCPAKLEPGYPDRYHARHPALWTGSLDQLVAIQAVSADPGGGTPWPQLADMEDTTTYTLGLGQKLAANWSGFVAVACDKRSDKAALSPLRPTDGRLGYTVGVSYQQGQFKLTPWLSYQRLGSVDISSGGTTLAAFDAESATAFGIRLGYQF